LTVCAALSCGPETQEPSDDDIFDRSVYRAFGLVLSTAVAAGGSAASQGDVFDRVTRATAVPEGGVKIHYASLGHPAEQQVSPNAAGFTNCAALGYDSCYARNLLGDIRRSTSSSAEDKRGTDIYSCASRTSSIFLRRIVGAMFMRVNSKCAHQVRPPPGRIPGEAVG